MKDEEWSTWKRLPVWPVRHSGHTSLLMLFEWLCLRVYSVCVYWIFCIIIQLKCVAVVITVQLCTVFTWSCKKDFCVVKSVVFATKIKTKNVFLLPLLYLLFCKDWKSHKLLQPLSWGSNVHKLLWANHWSLLVHTFNSCAREKRKWRLKPMINCDKLHLIWKGLLLFVETTTF